MVRIESSVRRYVRLLAGRVTRVDRKGKLFGDIGMDGESKHSARLTHLWAYKLGFPRDQQSIRDIYRPRGIFQARHWVGRCRLMMPSCRGM